MLAAFGVVKEFPTGIGTSGAQPTLSQRSNFCTVPRVDPR